MTNRAFVLQLLLALFPAALALGHPRSAENLRAREKQVPNLAIET
jgi:hypothetical protein